MVMKAIPDCKPAVTFQIQPDRGNIIFPAEIIGQEHADQADIRRSDGQQKRRILSRSSSIKIASKNIYFYLTKIVMQSNK